MRIERALSAGVLTVALVLLAACSPGIGSAGGVDSSNGTRSVRASAEATPLVVAIGGMITPKAGLAYYEDLVRYVGTKTGRKVELLSKADYAEINDMVEDREVDVAFVCSGPYTAGRKKFGMELLCAPQAYGVTTYSSYIIVPKDSAATKLDDLKGKTFALADPASNTGRLVPEYMLAKLGTTPERFFARTFYTYSHDNSIKAVAKKQADGAAVDSLIWEYANATDPTYTSQTRVIVRSEPFAIPPVVVHPDMDPALKAELRGAFLGLDKDPEAKPILEKMRIERFVVIEDSAYDSIRRMQDWVERQ